MRTKQAEEYVNINEEIADERVQMADQVQEEPQITVSLDQNEPTQKGNIKSSFVDGLAVGLGGGIIASFAIVWASLFFSPLLPQTATYESLLATFVYVLLSLLGFGLVALTAGVVREYYSKTKI
ncbi:MAG TPA: hypothetical protein VF893_00070 [Candidatus Bathyarchaeia archaeon]